MSSDYQTPSPEAEGRARALYRQSIWYQRVSAMGNHPIPRVPYAMASPALPPRRDGSRLPLPTPEPVGRSLQSLLEARRSTRGGAFSTAPLSLQDLATLVWGGYGRLPTCGPRVRRVVPSAGATYPLELFVVARRVEGLVVGTHAYDPADHALVHLPATTAHRHPAHWLFTTHFDPDGLSAVLVVVADLRRIAPRYGERGYRHALVEAGHVGQNIALVATALGRAVLPLGGLDEGLLSRALRLVEEVELPIYGFAT